MLACWGAKLFNKLNQIFKQYVFILDTRTENTQDTD